MSDSQRGVQTIMGAIQDMTDRQIPRDPWIEVGYLDEGYNLVIANSIKSTDGKPISYPPDRYSIARHLCVNPTYLTATADGVTAARDPSSPLSSYVPPASGQHPHGPSGGHAQYQGDGVHSHPATEGEHPHPVLTPPALAPPQPGDMVEIHWTNNFTDPIVAAVLVNGMSLLLANGLGAAGATPTSPGSSVDVYPPVPDMTGDWHWDPARFGWFKD